MSDLERRIASLSPEQRALLEKRLREQTVPAGETLTPIRRGPETGPARLSFAQERLWFLDQLEPGNPYYNIHKAIRWNGPLDLDALGRALETILARHDALRTTFVAVDGAPFQVVDPSSALPLPVTDLRGYPPPEREAQMLQLAVEEARRPFDLSRDRLVRARLLRLGDEEHVFLLTIHHIVSDGWSMGLFFGELATLYAAFSKGEPSPLPDLPIQYADYAGWQRDNLRGEVLESQLDYWTQRLSGMPPVLDFPSDRPRPARRGGRGAGQTFSVERKLLDALRALSRREGVTLYMTLLAAFQTLLGRYADSEEIVVGSPEAGRHRVETEPLIGYFVNMLVLRTDLRGDPTFRELLTRVRDVVLGAQTRPEVPFERLIDELGLDRSLRYNPVFQVMFAFQKEPHSMVAPPGLTASPVSVRTGAAVFDLTLEMTERQDGLEASLGYDTDLFDDATATRMVEHFGRLLEGIVEDSERPLSRLPLSSEEERRRLLVEWNDTAAEFPSEKCVHRLFEEQASRAPEAAAVLFGSERLTYRELNRRANRLGNHLRRLGVGSGDVVGLCAERSVEMTVGLLGILKAGAAYLPLDPTLPPERLSLLLEETRTGLLLTQQRLVPSLPAFGGRRVLLDVDSEAIALESEENLDGGASADDLAYVTYTSGSTGRPNGVRVAHRSLVNFTVFAAEAFGLSPRDRVLQFASISFDAAAEEIYPCWHSGATLVLRTNAMLDDFSSFLDACRQWGVTVLDLPTAYWNDLVAGLSQEPLDFPEGVRLVVIGGERALPERLEAWRKRFGARVRLVNTYGPTEATVAATSWECPASGEEEDGLRLREVPIGRPIRNVQAYVLDRAGQPVPLGGWGELHIGGVGLARGYLGNEELTAAKFIANPFSDRPDSRLYRSGDRARHRADGELELRGRLDQQLKIRGYRVEPGEVEAALAEHGSVRDVAVVGQEEMAGDRSLVGYVSLRPEQAVSAGDLKRFLRARLPSYMVPSHIVLLDALPRTAGGKPDRRALACLPRSPQKESESESEFVAPRTVIEQSLAGIWAEVLRIDRLGIHDNFFDLGGHSLLATRVLARLQATFSVRLPLRTLFDQPTIAQLSAAIEELRGSDSGPSRSAIAPVSRRAISGEAGSAAAADESPPKRTRPE
jgi:amino acid adenylation domain-containing protein